MLRRKRALALLLTAVVAGSAMFSSCGKKSGKVEVDIFQFKVEIAEQLQDAIDDYMKDNPDVKINLETVGGGDDYGASLRAKFQSGNEPDIFNIGGPQDLEDWESKLEDLSKEKWVDSAVAGVLDGVSKDGKIFGLPFNVEGYGFIYNKAIFEAAGIDGKSIKSYNDLESAVKKLDKMIKGGELKEQFPDLEAVFEFPSKEKWVTGLHTANAALSQEFNSSIDSYNAKTVQFKYGDGLKNLIDIQANYSSNGDNKQRLNAVDYATQVKQGLAIQRVAIIQQGNWIYNDVKGIDESVADNLGILPMPVVGAKEDSIPVGVPMNWSVNKDSSDKEREAAKDFLNWLYTSDEGKDYVVNKFYFIPALKGYGDVKPKDAIGRAVMEYTEEDRVLPWVFMGFPSAWGMDMLGSNIQKYVAGEMTWEELEADSKATWEKARK